LKPTVYIETTIPSYLVSRNSRDVVILAHQEITRIWWKEHRLRFNCYISPIVIEEARAGDPHKAKLRLEVLVGSQILEANKQVESLTKQYLEQLDIPDKAIRDAAHLAFACVYEIDFLLTWNCTHIANGQIIRQLSQINAVSGIITPTICTPEELFTRKVD
jgi:hypothetical protein